MSHSLATRALSYSLLFFSPSANPRLLSNHLFYIFMSYISLHHPYLSMTAYTFMSIQIQALHMREACNICLSEPGLFGLVQESLSLSILLQMAWFCSSLGLNT